jgi:hypothetical protein
MCHARDDRRYAQRLSARADRFWSRANRFSFVKTRAENRGSRYCLPAHNGSRRKTSFGKAAIMRPI